jgi:hypothetical protein
VSVQLAFSYGVPFSACCFTGLSSEPQWPSMTWEARLASLLLPHHSTSTPTRDRTCRSVPVVGMVEASGGPPADPSHHPPRVNPTSSSHPRQPTLTPAATVPLLSCLQVSTPRDPDHPLPTTAIQSVLRTSGPNPVETKAMSTRRPLELLTSVLAGT